MAKVLMVCTANICRSPMAQVVTMHCAAKAGLGRDVVVDAAGTHAGRIGDAPDPRGKAALSNRGYVVGKTRSRRVVEKDFSRFDLVLAMDQGNLNALREICPAEHAHKLRMFLEYAPELGILEIPDPYFGGPDGFERVLDLCEAAAKGLVGQLRTGAIQTL